MNIKGFKRMLFGEKMPDKDDPQYKERYEREVQAGHKFAKATRTKRQPRCRALPTRTERCFWSSSLHSSSELSHGTPTAW